MAGKEAETQLAIDGGGRPRRRKADRYSFTEAKQTAFFDALADSCNVKLAAQIAGVSPSNVYVRRETDATFRAGWDRALAEGYAKLEMEMLKRALHGVEKTVVRGGETSIMQEYNDRVGLALLRMHRETVASIDGGEIETGEYEEARERIVARIERIREQADGEVLALECSSQSHDGEGGHDSPTPIPSPEGEGSL